MQSNNDLMDPNWKPGPLDEFEQEWCQFYNTFPDTPNIVHVRNWAHELWKRQRWQLETARSALEWYLEAQWLGEDTIRVAKHALVNIEEIGKGGA